MWPSVSSASGSGTTLPTGAIIPWTTTTAPSGWLLCDGATLGNASSGATRASDDYEDLFAHLWDNFADSELAVAGGRGASAAADWAADKTIVLLDTRGRAVLGADNMGGSSADRVTAAAADTIGKASGAETHTLTEAEMPAHNHDATLEAVDDDPGAVLAGNVLASNSPGVAATPDVSSSTAAIAVANAGSGNAHNNMPPYLTLNWIIKV